MILAPETARGDLHYVAGFDAGAPAARTFAHDHFDRRGFDFGYLTDEFAGHGPGEVFEGRGLLRISLAVHNEDRLAATRLIAHVAKCAIGLHNGDDVQAIQSDPVPRALFHGPNEHAFPAAESHFRIGDTRARVNIARTHFQIVARDARPDRLDAERGG